MTPLLWATAAFATAPVEFHHRFSAESLASLDIVQPAGAVTVIATPRLALAEAHAEPEAWDESCELVVTRSAGKASLTVAGGTSLLRSCRLSWTIRVRPSTDLHIDIGQGGVALEGMSGRNRIQLGNGALTLDAVTGRLTADVAAGSVSGSFSGAYAAVALGKGGIHLDGLLAPTTARTGIGNIALTFGLAPRGRVVAETGAGAVTILMPRATPVALEWGPVVGIRNVELPETPTAASNLKLGCGVGSVLVTDLESERGRRRARVPH